MSNLKKLGWAVLLAEKIEAMLHEKGAFREVLPVHLDQPKFRWMVRHDIKRVIEQHLQAREGVKKMKTLTIILALAATAAIAAPIKEQPTRYAAQYVAATNDVATWAAYTNAISKATKLSDVQAACLALGTAKEKAAKDSVKPKEVKPKEVKP